MTPNHSEIPNRSAYAPEPLPDVYALADMARNSGVCVHDFEVAVEPRHRALDDLVREAQAWGCTSE